MRPRKRNERSQVNFTAASSQSARDIRRMVCVHDNLVTFPVFQVHFYIVCCIGTSFVWQINK